MGRRVVLLLALAIGGGCSVREIEEDGESRRHLAAQWCEDYCAFRDGCEHRIVSVQDCRDGCESDEAWDWTDECGDIKWAYHQCKESKICEDFLEDPDDPHAPAPCQEHMEDFLLRGCSYE